MIKLHQSAKNVPYFQIKSNEEKCLNQIETNSDHITMEKLVLTLMSAFWIQTFVKVDGV